MKKFFRLMNQAAEIQTDSGQSASDAYDYSSTSIMGESDEDVFKQFGLDASKYGLDENQEEAPKAESQGSEDEQEAAPVTEESAILEQINALGIIHNESPFKVESVDQIKELMQKGQDYTVKTQALSNERKDFESDRDATKAQLNEEIDRHNAEVKGLGQKLQELEQFVFTIEQLRTSAPDIFEEVQRFHKETERQYSNPIINQQLEAIRAENAATRAENEEIKKSLFRRENELIIDSFDSKFAALAPHEQSLKELGIIVNRDAVKEKWAATGLEPEAIVDAMYAKMERQARASKSKVQATTQKVAAKPIGAAGSSRTGSKAPSIDPKLSGLGYASALWDRHTKR
jgi:hypothetical protein